MHPESNCNLSFDSKADCDPNSLDAETFRALGGRCGFIFTDDLAENSLKTIQDLELRRASIARDYAGGVTKEASSNLLCDQGCIRCPCSWVILAVVWLLLFLDCSALSKFTL